MHYGIERNEHITVTRARGDAWTVRDQDGQRIGVISHGDRGWTVFAAGWGVVVDHQKVHPFKDAAITTLVEAREAASQPGGALAVEGGLTGHQRAMIDLMRKYAMVTDRDVMKRVIWEAFEVSATEFYVVWNALLDSPAAAGYDGPTVNRGRRIRDQHKAARTRKPVPA